MTFLALHLLGYIALALVLATGTTRAISYNHARSHKALMIRITKLESELGLGVFWAKDELDQFTPELSRPSIPGYTGLKQYAFRCIGCETSVVYADYDGRQIRTRVFDSHHVLCNTCFPRKEAA